MSQRTQKTTRSKSPTPAAAQESFEDSHAGFPGKSFIELITVQWQRERGDLDLSNFLLGIYLMRLGTIIERAFGRQCEERYGISGSDMRVLFALRRGGLPYVKRPTDLFRALLVTSGAITKKVDRLAELGMVERLQDPGHLGGFLVRLTRKGLHIADEMVESLANESVIAPAMDLFTKTERENGNRFALRMLSGLEAAGLSEAPVDERSEAKAGRKRRAAT